MATEQSFQEGTSQPNDLGLSTIFDYEELQEATKFFNPSQVIGEGGFGVVYQGMLEDKRAVAVKELTVPHKQRMEQFSNEARVLSRLHHKNLVALYGCTHPEDEKMFLVYEFVPNGTVASHLGRGSAPKEVLTWKQRFRIAVQTAEALTYLHSLEPPLIHRDVKTENILLDDDFNVKIADFGMCRHLPPSGAQMSTIQGTQGYLDPEYNLNFKLTAKSDVFSFGVVMMELISGMAPVDIERDGDEVWLVRMALKKIKNEQLDQLVDQKLGYQDDSEVFHMINSVAQIAYHCLQPTGDRRPRMIDVLKSLKAISDHQYPVSGDTPDRRNMDRRALKAVRDWMDWPQFLGHNTTQRTVCVIGAGGFMSSWLVKLLLLKGYTVKGTVRNPDDAKYDHLRALDGAAERLILCKADLLDYDSLRRAIDGCVGVFHTISPLVDDNLNQIEESTAVNGTRYVIDAAADAGVRRVVYTSSLEAVLMSDVNLPAGVVVDESYWSDPDYCQENGSWYSHGKLMAEQAAWETAGNRGLHLLVVCLGHVYGPMLQPGINFPNTKILKYIGGSTDTTGDNSSTYVDVRNVAEAHVRVFEAPRADGRYLCIESILTQMDFICILAEQFPEYPLPPRCLDKKFKGTMAFSSQKLRQLGLKFTPAKQCLYDTVKSLQDKGSLSIISST